MLKDIHRLALATKKPKPPDLNKNGFQGIDLMNTIYIPFETTLQNDRFLKRLSSGKADTALWHTWGIQRYRAAEGFLAFLESAHKKAEKHKLENLATEIHNNILDEKGLSRTDGTTPTNSGSHENWRKAFYTSLGISEEQLHSTPVMEATQQYKNLLKSIQDKGDVWEHIKALQTIECIVPIEFAFIKQGLEKTLAFKSVCRDNKNIMYIDHHISHDLLYHAPSLLNAAAADLTKHEKTSHGKASHSVFDIANTENNKILQARLALYSALEQGTRKRKRAFRPSPTADH